jgi:hypothetical protein
MRQRRGRGHKTQTEPIQVNGWNQVAGSKNQLGIAGMNVSATSKKNPGLHRFFFYVASAFMLALGYVASRTKRVRYKYPAIAIAWHRAAP